MPRFECHVHAPPALLSVAAIALAFVLSLLMSRARLYHAFISYLFYTTAFDATCVWHGSGSERFGSRHDRLDPDGLFFFLMIRRPPKPPFFPSTTLFRSHERGEARGRERDHDRGAVPPSLREHEHVGRDHDQLPVGEVDEPQHAEHEPDPDGDQRVDQIGRAHV